jgi:hypothetical protein
MGHAPGDLAAGTQAGRDLLQKLRGRGLLFQHFRKSRDPGFFVWMRFGKFRNSEPENSRQARSCFAKLTARDRMPEEKRITEEQDSA